MKKNVIILLFLFLVFEGLPQTTAIFETGNLGVSLHKAYGRLRFYIPNTTTGTRLIDRTCLLVGCAPTEVYDYKNDYDAEDTPKVVTNPQFSDFEIYGSFNYNYSNVPPNVLSKWNIYGWTNKKYVVVKFTIVNRETSSKNYYIGMESILNTRGIQSGGDTIEYIPEKKIIYAHNQDSANSGSIGMRLLSSTVYSLKNMEWFTNYWVGDTLLYNMLTLGTIENVFYSPYLGEPTTNFFSQPAVNLAPGGKTEMWVAYAFAGPRDSVVALLDEANTKYGQMTDVDELPNVPTQYALNQNYPNPFNPNTVISYQIPTSQFVSLKVYNILGNEVAKLVNEVQSPSTYNIEFNGNNLSTGTYYYELRAGNYREVKKMILIK